MLTANNPDHGLTQAGNTLTTEDLFHVQVAPHPIHCRISLPEFDAAPGPAGPGL
ncbi:MAG: hypothetical protein PsegKO_28370 [Pseudohongiellaceae bacterium]